LPRPRLKLGEILQPQRKSLAGRWPVLIFDGKPLFSDPRLAPPSRFLQKKASLNFKQHFLEENDHGLV
jgi:hypothetical protein